MSAHWPRGSSLLPSSTFAQWLHPRWSPRSLYHQFSLLPYVFNFSFSSGSYPAAHKHGKVISSLKTRPGVLIVAQQKQIWLVAMKMQVPSRASLSGLRRCHKQWRRWQTRLGSGVVGGLWCRPEAAALIPPLAWASPHAAGAALKRKKKKPHKTFPARS